MEGAQQAVKSFWDTRVAPDPSVHFEVAGENRCPDCNRMYKREQDLKAHYTRGCALAVASRKGTRAELAVAKAQQVALQETAGVVMMAGKRLRNVFNFKYLGFYFQADGDRLPAMLQRMAIARSRFGELHLSLVTIRPPDP